MSSSGGQRAEGRAGPAQPPNLVRRDVRRATDIRLEPGGAGPDFARLLRGPTAGVAPLPGGEAVGHRLEALAGALVRVGHDALFSCREGGPPAEGFTVRESGDRVRGDRPGQLRVTASGQPVGRALAVG